jgi:hypothetical protein
MKIMNNNPLDLRGRDGEIIDVEIKSTNTTHLVSRVLDGQRGSQPSNSSVSKFSFQLDKTQFDPSILTMLFTFSSQNDGSYEITVSGDPNGQTSHFSVAQLFGIPGDAITYTVDVA